MHSASTTSMQMMTVTVTVEYRATHVRVGDELHAQREHHQHENDGHEDVRAVVDDDKAGPQHAGANVQDVDHKRVLLRQRPIRRKALRQQRRHPKERQQHPAISPIGQQSSPGRPAHNTPRVRFAHRRNATRVTQRNTACS
eukprot:4150517-Pyramimonas_sp.AAC.1